MNATIKQLTVTRNIGLCGRKGTREVQVWSITGETNGHPWDIETEDAERAQAYKTAIDANDENAIDRLFAESRGE